MKTINSVHIHILFIIGIMLLSITFAFAQTNSTKTPDDHATSSSIHQFELNHDATMEHKERGLQEHSIQGTSALSDSWRNFHITHHGKQVFLHWETNSISRQHSFGIEHRIGGSDWQSLATVKANSSAHDGEHIHHFPLSKLNSGQHDFRLSYHNQNDENHYSHAISLKLDIHDTHQLMSIAPTHSHQDLHMALTPVHSQHIKIHFVNAQGHTIETLFSGNVSARITHALSFLQGEISKEAHAIHIDGKHFHWHHEITHTP